MTIIEEVFDDGKNMHALKVLDDGEDIFEEVFGDCEEIFETSLMMLSLKVIYALKCLKW